MQTPPNNKRPLVIAVVKALGEMLGKLVDAADSLKDLLPQWARYAVEILPLLMEHADIVLDASVYVIRTVLWIILAGWRRLVHGVRRVRRRRYRPGRSFQRKNNDRPPALQGECGS